MAVKRMLERFKTGTAASKIKASGIGGSLANMPGKKRNLLAKQFVHETSFYMSEPITIQSHNLAVWTTQNGHLALEVDKKNFPC